MRLVIFLLLLCCTEAFNTTAQTVGIGTTAPNINAALDINDSQRGFLPPRTSTITRLAMPNVKGMIVYDTTTLSLWRNNGTAWVNDMALPQGSNSGDLLYWNGTAWTVIPAGPYGKSLVFCNGVPACGGCIPLLSTNPVGSILAYSAIDTATVLDYGAPLQGNSNQSTTPLMGFCWSTTPNPTIASPGKVAGYDFFDASNYGKFTAKLTGLVASTTYYIRSYKNNSIGLAYGPEVSFTTQHGIVSISTKPITYGDGNPVSGGIVDSGGTLITSRGLVWGTSTNPTIALSTKTINGSGSGAYTSKLNFGIQPNTTYYVRVYATNELGTVYGNELTYTSGPYVVGQNAQGGIVFYVDSMGQHGYACTSTTLYTSNPGQQFYWAPVTQPPVNALGNDIGTGQANTTTIINAFPTGIYAAKICDTTTRAGYNDWFLPSRGELMKMFENLVLVGYSGFGSTFYWSSSENPDITGHSWAVNMNVSNFNIFWTADKTNNAYYVRGVRRF